MTLSAEPIVAVASPGVGGPAAMPDLAAAVDRSVAESRTLLGRSWRALEASWSVVDPSFGTILGAGEPVGGKFVRARLAAASYLGFGGEYEAVAAQLAAAVQLLHAALCLHDDIIDGDDRRHGRRNVIGVVADMDARRGCPATVARRQGTAAALLVGDLLLSRALRAAAEVDTTVAVGTGTSPGRIALEFHAALSASIQGELLDVRSEWAPLDQVDAQRVAVLKTAAYSTVLPLRAGAIAAGRADDATLDRLRRIGEAIGVAYQMADDELGLLGDESATGKPARSDLRTGKRTELLAIAYRRAGPGDRRILLDSLATPGPDPAAQRQVIDIVLRTGALDHSRELARHLADQAADAARWLPPVLGDYIGQLVSALADRTT